MHDAYEVLLHDYESGTNELMLDVVDAVLSHHERVMSFVRQYRYSDEAETLESILLEAGSAWTINWLTADDEVGVSDPVPLGLRRRLGGEVEDELLKLSLLATGKPELDHLARAKGKIFGRSPDASAGYQEVVRALEAALKPMVAPDNDRTSFGTISADLKQA